MENNLNEKWEKWKKYIKEMLKFIVKTLAITIVCLAFGVPVLSATIKPVVKAVVYEALGEELSITQDYILGDMERAAYKQLEKITKGHTNIYPVDVENAIKNVEIIRDKFPKRFTPKLRLCLESMLEWYKSS